MMRLALLFALILVLAVGLVLSLDSPAGAADKLPQPAAKFLTKYCLDCHDNSTKEAGLSLESLAPRFADHDLMKVWVRAYDRISENKMPPADAEQPSAEERRKALGWLGGELAKASLARQQERGRVVLKRLNRTEYENTLNDLLGVFVKVKDFLPGDSTVAGFDTVSEGLEISSVHLVRYQKAAEMAVNAAFPWRPEGKINKRWTGREHSTKTIHMENALKSAGFLRGDSVVYHAKMWQHGTIHTDRTQRPGRYRIRARVHVEGTEGKSLPIMFAHMDVGVFAESKMQHVIHFFDAQPQTKEFEFTVELPEGRRVYLEPWALPLFRSSPYKKHVIDEKKTEKFVGPAVVVEWLEMEGPLDLWPVVGYQRMFDGLPLASDRMVKGSITEELKLKQHPNEWIRDPYQAIPKDPKKDAARLIAKFLPIALRRPVEKPLVDFYVNFAHERLDRGYTFTEAMKTTYKAVLCSPWFLYRYEKPGPLDDWAIASRLSYFLWSSMPDDELFKLAAESKLREPAVRHAQVQRMLKDPRAKQFTENFTGQWLDLRKLHMTNPDKMYREWNKPLLWAMPLETQAFFDEILRNDRSLLEFVDSDWTFLNERLAQHYDIPNVKGWELRKVKLPENSNRGGVMTHASVLKVTANGTTTSPITRGAWVLDRIVGKPPSPPPPNAPAIEPDIRGATTVREQLSKHRDVKSCAMCHKYIDPPGFALETYDVIGGWRTRYRSGTGGEGKAYEELVNYPGQKVWLAQDVEQGYVTPEGQEFADTKAYKKILLADKEQLARNLAEKLMIYATGADIQFADREIVDKIVKRAESKNFGFRSLIHEVVESRVFLNK